MKNVHKYEFMYKKSIFLIFLIIFFIFIAIFKTQIYKKYEKNNNIMIDWTIIAPPISTNKYVDTTWVISFTNDDSDVFRSAQKYLNFSLNWFGFKKIINYSTSDIKNLIQKYPKFYKNKKYLQRGFGLWTWKPYLILETLNKIPENDILFYIDSGSAINNDLSSIFFNFDNQNIDLIVFEIDSKRDGMELTNDIMNKKSFLKYMNLDNDNYKKKHQIGANIIFIRNNLNTRKLIKKWLNLCLKEELISPLTKEEAIKNNISINKNFKKHLEDQSILDAVLYKYGKNIKYLSSKKYVDYKIINFKSENNFIIAQTKKDLKESLIDIIKFKK